MTPETKAKKRDTFTYKEDGTLICDQCGKVVTKVLNPHWKRMQKVMAEGGKPWTDTITLGATIRHREGCSKCHPYG